MKNDPNASDRSKPSHLRLAVRWLILLGIALAVFAIAYELVMHFGVHATHGPNTEIGWYLCLLATVLIVFAAVLIVVFAVLSLRYLVKRAQWLGHVWSGLFTWAGARWCLVGVAVLATLIAVFYAEEYWRGRRAWENAKREFEARGVSLDWSDYIPPPVPDAQNIFKSPKMQEWFVRRPYPARGSTELTKSMTNAATWSVGSADNSIANPAKAQEYIEWSNRFTNDFALIRAALKRPYARMEGNYERLTEMPIPNFVTLRSVAQLLAQRTHCYLLLEQPENALRELTLLRDLHRFLEAQPTSKPTTLVAAMINVAITGLYVTEIADGMELHAWGEPQLLAIQKQLEQVNLIPQVEQAFWCEPAGVCRAVEITQFRKFMSLGKAASDASRRSGSDDALWDWLKNLSLHLYDLVPRGWAYQNMAVFIRLSARQLEGFSADGQRIEPQAIKRSQTEIKDALAQKSLFNLLARIAIPNYSRATQTLAYNQTLANEGQIACALERYRIAHSHYPEKLEALVPQFATKLARDVIGGQPLKYRRTGDGGFLLYSVGWNEQDDGGQFALNSNGRPEFDAGDWVWRYPTK